VTRSRKLRFNECTMQPAYIYDHVPSCAPQFTGKERDSESGLDNFGARYDSSSLGRFLIYRKIKKQFPRGNYDQHLGSCQSEFRFRYTARVSSFLTRNFEAEAKTRATWAISLALSRVSGLKLCGRGHRERGFPLTSQREARARRR